MRVSQRLDHAMRFMVALARLPEGGSVGAGEAAEAVGIPRRFGEQQATALARAGLVVTRRGSGGGCALARAAAEITALDVVVAIEGGALDVSRAAASATSSLWGDVARTLEQRLAATTLEDLAREQTALDEAAEAMYFI